MEVVDWAESLRHFPTALFKELTLHLSNKTTPFPSVAARKILAAAAIRFRTTGKLRLEVWVNDHPNRLWETVPLGYLILLRYFSAVPFFL